MKMSGQWSVISGQGSKTGILNPEFRIQNSEFEKELSAFISQELSVRNHQKEAGDRRPKTGGANRSIRESENRRIGEPGGLVHSALPIPHSAITFSLQPVAFGSQESEVRSQKSEQLVSWSAGRLVSLAFLLFTFYFLLFTFSPAFAQEDDFGAENFMEAAQADDAKITREQIRNAIVRMSGGIRAGKDEQVNRAVERRAQKIANPEIKALLYYTLSQAYEENGKKRAALHFLDKALNSSIKRKPFYQKKKEELLQKP